MNSACRLISALIIESAVSVTGGAPSAIDGGSIGGSECWRDVRGKVGVADLESSAPAAR